MQTTKKKLHTKTVHAFADGKDKASAICSSCGEQYVWLGAGPWSHARRWATQHVCTSSDTVSTEQ